jgi:hypothetical protein
VVEAVEEAQQALVDHRVMTNAAGEVLELSAARQLAVQDEIARLDEAALRGELLYWVTAVQQQPCVTIDVRDAAFARSGYRESGVEREDLVLAVDRRDIDHPGAQSAFADGKLRRPAGGAVAELERPFGRSSGNASRRRDCIHVHLQHSFRCAG